MPADKGEQLRLVQAYRELVERYEEQDRQIDELIMRHGGLSQNMPAAARERYRQMAARRMELLNQMRRMEQQLNIDSDVSAGAANGGEE